MKDAIIYAGYSRLADGTMKFRTATTHKRVTQLEALGEEVHMVIINDVYTKSAAAKELLRIDHANGAKELEKFYTAQVRDENPFKKTTRVVKLKVPSVAMQKLTGAKIETEELSTAEARKIRNEWNRKHAHLSYDGE
jgi:thioesterase domain-containing protein